MSTLFVERCGACVGGEGLIDEKALEKLRSALPETDRARLHWVMGYVGSSLLAPDEIRDMGVWLDLFGHAREVGMDMGQIRSFIDSARGERFLQKHDVRSVDAVHGSASRSNDDAASGDTLRRHHSNDFSPDKKKRRMNGHDRSPLAAKLTNGHNGNHGYSHTLKPGQSVRDLDERRGKRSGKVVEVGDGYARIQWDSGRVNAVALKRLLVPRLFSIGSSH